MKTLSRIKQEAREEYRKTFLQETYDGPLTEQEIGFVDGILDRLVDEIEKAVMKDLGHSNEMEFVFCRDDVREAFTRFKGEENHLYCTKEKRDGDLCGKPAGSGELCARHLDPKV